MSSHEDDGPSPLTRIAQLESFVKQLRMAPRQRKCVLPDLDKFNDTSKLNYTDPSEWPIDSLNYVYRIRARHLAAWTLFRLFRPFRPVPRIFSTFGTFGPSSKPPSHVNGPSFRRPNRPFNSRTRSTTRAIAARQRARRYKAYRRSRG
ncbi:hypothetical protein MBM_05438 [Drepanopeziza brunnea f. sp. 'multigermtubi' MB_m1]|uniref:Uncharacterized protein n=1 Tax=Marssonina brunnea f. sp. multigermtubi (strain MB_m1) TaxID=1072389 RepID=K1XU64_MARBU|nr:uncharacterized protein MBM_05438 [Drepanopeziza brunnea f. sp. 'multigermtubi' MB_m1]EKD16144.1 hypothetical protein MBM_05438 [Drepanopeziza brunnea f. sp. 'multigermtubi' MB_m1]